VTVKVYISADIEGVTGVVLIIGEKMGAWGRVELLELQPGNP